MAKASESDIRMMIATQVAYLDATPGAKVSDVISRTISRYEGRSDLSAMEKSQLEYAQNLQSTIEKNHLYDCNYWIVKEVSDDNQQSGFYGCLIDTRDGDAIVGFRGSETMADPNQLVKDWAIADFGLLNNADTTRQQQLAQEFTRQVNEHYGNQYEAFSFSGHSLGGNLAEHATVTAPDGMSIRRCTNYDGPGYSDEYIQRYADQIARRGQYIDHYQYSVVGSLLNRLPGTNYQTIAAHNGDGIPPFSLISRHDTACIEFDGYGNVQNGGQDPLAAVMGAASRGIENGPPAWLWFVAPQFAVLWSMAEAGPELLASLKQQTEQFVTSIKNTLQSLKQTITNWFRSMFGVALTGEFELNVSYINALADDMDEVSRKLGRISGDISNIASKLRYNSITGSLVKSKLWSLSNKVDNDKKKVSAIADAVRSCTQYAVQSDTQVAQLCRSV